MIVKLKASGGTFVRQDAADRNFAKTPNLVLNGSGSAARRAFLFFGAIPRKGILTSAVLRVFLRGAWSGGPHTITVKPITQGWKENRATWTNQPNVAAGSATNAITGGANGQMVDITVTSLVAAAIAGGDWHGLRLGLDTTGNKDLHSDDTGAPTLRPVLILTWSEAPEAPDDLRPISGAVVGPTKPILGWAYRDPQGDEQAKLNVQIATSVGGFGAPEYDSGWINAKEAELDLTTTAYAGLPIGDRYWRVRVEDINGHQSDFSEVAKITRAAKGTLTISSPATGGTTEDLSPQIASALSLAQSKIAYRVEESSSGATGWRELSDFDPHPAPATAAATYAEALPEGLITDPTKSYRVTVRSWDTLAREASPGDPPYVEATTTFTFIRSTAPTDVTATAVVSTGTPFIRLTFNRASLPDAFALYASATPGGTRTLRTLIDSADAFVSGTSYAYDWGGALPRITYDIEIAAVAFSSGANRVSDSNPVVTGRVDPVGIWLLDTEASTSVQLLGRDDAPMRYVEEGETFLTIGGEPVRVVDTVGGYAGNVSGLLYSAGERDELSAMELESVAYPGRVRLVIANLNLPVVLGELAIEPLPNPGGNDYSAAVAFWQVAETTRALPGS